jgi:hypothetical protein
MARVGCARWSLPVAFAAMVLVVPPQVAWAQATPAAAAESAEKALADAWKKVFDDVRQRRDLAADEISLKRRDGTALTPEESRAVYDEIAARLLATDGLTTRFDNLDEYRRLVNETAKQIPEAKLAKTVNGGLTNPAAGTLLERSGFTDLIALAADAKNIFSTDQSAVTVNLNALALVRAGDPDVYTQPRIYREMGALRSVGGSFTFGAQLPKGEITGFSGFPDFDKVFDVVSWDVKFRVFGDRDPRAEKWWPLMSQAGAIGQISALAVTLDPLPAADAPILAQALNGQFGTVIERLKERISRSAQVSVKVAGQHLSNESGMNKYTAGALADLPLGAADATLDFTFSSVEAALPSGPGVKLRDVSFVFGISATLAQNAIVSGRGIEVSLSGDGRFPVNDVAALPDRKSVWRIGAAAAIPVGKSGKIPVSVTWTNDPNNLVNERFVTGHIGLSYDFGGLKSLFTSPM